jgi:spore maturation protein CgeB
MDLLARNLAALARRDPSLAAQIGACAPSADTAIEGSRSGAPTLRIAGRLEASAEDPEQEARDLCARFAAVAARAGATRWVLFGLGVHTLRFLEPPRAPLLVIEPSLAVCRAVFEAVDLAEALARVDLLATDRVEPALRHPAFRGGATAGDSAGLGGAAGDLLGLAASGLPERGIFLAHPAARRRARAFHDALAERFVPGGTAQPLDIAVVPPLGGGSLPVARAVARALRQLGHRVREVDWTPFCAAYDELDRATADVRLGARRGALRAALSRVLGELLLTRFGFDPPDLVFALAQAPLDGETLAALGRRGIVRAFWFCEDAYVLPYWKELCSAYDVFFHLQPDVLAEPLRSVGVRGAPLPLGFDPSVHRPLALDLAEQQRYGCSLSFVGGGYHNRRQFLPGLADLGLRLYGTAWPAVSPFREMSPEFNVWQSEEASNRIFNASKINLNLHSSPWVDGVNPAGDYVNPRTYELAGARAFQLVDRRRELPQFFAVDREVATFRDLAECRRKIAYYLAHEDERREIAEQSQRRALAAHTYRHRMAEAIERIGAGPVPLAPRRRTAPTAGAVAAVPECEAGLRRVLERLDPDRVLDASAFTEAVQHGEGPLTEEEQLLLFMREALGEVVPLDAAGNRA